MCVTSAELADPEQAWLTWSQLAASPEVLCTPQTAGSTPALFFFLTALCRYLIGHLENKCGVSCNVLRKQTAQSGAEAELFQLSCVHERPMRKTCALSGPAHMCGVVDVKSPSLTRRIGGRLSGSEAPAPRDECSRVEFKKPIVQKADKVSCYCKEKNDDCAETHSK